MRIVAIPGIVVVPRAVPPHAGIGEKGERKSTPEESDGSSTPHQNGDYSLTKVGLLTFTLNWVTLITPSQCACEPPFLLKTGEIPTLFSHSPRECQPLCAPFSLFSPSTRPRAHLSDIPNISVIPGFQEEVEAGITPFSQLPVQGRGWAHN